MSKASYYYVPQGAHDRRKRPLDNTLVALLQAITGYETTYGYRKVTKKLIVYNHKKVYRHMEALNLLQPKKIKKKNYKRLPWECPIVSNVRWEADLTYVWDGTKCNYLFAVVDCYDKEPIGDHYGLRARSDEAIVSLEEAVKTRFGSLEPYNEFRVTLRVDQGSQYISKDFRRRAKELGIKLAYCGIDCPDDKPYIESFFSRYKCEEVYRNQYRGYTDAFLGWLNYKDWYKSERIHQGLGYLTIPQFKQRGLLIAG